MAKRSVQLLLDDSFRYSPVHGGEFSVGKRKKARPLSTKKPMHLTVRSSFAVGPWVFTTNKNRTFISRLIRDLAKKWDIKIYEHSINSNHLHFALRAVTRRGFQNFERVLTARIARFITGARRGKPFGKRFFDLPAFTRIPEWVRDFLSLCRYVVQNVLEASGVIAYQPRPRKKKCPPFVPKGRADQPPRPLYKNAS